MRMTSTGSSTPRTPTRPKAERLRGGCRIDLLRRFAWLIAVAVWVALAAAPARATGPAEAIAQAFPRAWCGQYRWRGDPVIQQFALVFSSVSVRHRDGRVIAGGRATIAVPGRRYTLLVTATIDPATRTIELREHRPEPDTPDFTTDGAHRGSIGPRLRSIRAVWTQNGTGEQGDLSLHAVTGSGVQPPVCGVPSV